MAESQKSPDPVAGQDPGTVQATGEAGDATRSDQGNSAASQSQPGGNAELDEITRTVSAGGEEAVKIVKHWQRVASEKDGKLAPFKKIEDLLTTIGGGDIAAGAANAETYLRQYGSVLTNPEAKAAITRFLDTGQWASSQSNGDNLGGGDDDFLDPTDRTLDELNRRLSRVEGTGAIQEVKDVLSSCFKEEIAEGVALGEVLNDEEKTTILTGLKNHVQRYSTSGDGQKVLQNLNPDSIRSMIQLQLGFRKWGEIGERAHLEKIKRKQSAATGAAPTGGTTGNEDRSYSGNLAEALDEFAKELGVDLNKMPLGR